MKNLIAIIAMIIVAASLAVAIRVNDQKLAQEGISSNSREFRYAAEKAYFLGQIDALEGRVVVGVRDGYYTIEMAPSPRMERPVFNPELGYRAPKRDTVIISTGESQWRARIKDRMSQAMAELESQNKENKKEQVCDSLEQR